MYLNPDLEVRQTAPTAGAGSAGAIVER